MYYQLSIVFHSLTVGLLGRFITQNYYQPVQINIVTPTSQDGFELKFETAKSNSRARKMWHLAYTLICNSNLTKLRRREKREHKTTTSGFTLELSVAGNSIFDYDNEENKLKLEFP